MGAGVDALAGEIGSGYVSSLTGKETQMGGLRMGELLIILVVVLILFGAARLPQLGSSLGQAIKNFKKGFGTESEEPPSPSNNRDVSTLSSASTVDNKDVDRAKTPQKTA
jgi:sec-independent protein translocase protein TatA